MLRQLYPLPLNFPDLLLYIYFRHFLQMLLVPSQLLNMGDLTGPDVCRYHFNIPLPLKTNTLPSSHPIITEPLLLIAGDPLTAAPASYSHNFSPVDITNRPCRHLILYILLHLLLLLGTILPYHLSDNSTPVPCII